MKNNARLVRSDLLSVISEESNDLVMRQLVSRKVDGPEISMTWVAMDGEHRPLKTDASMRVYYILEGDFTFDCNNTDLISAAQGDVVIIYKSCVYSFAGKGKYLVMNGPAFQDGDDIYIEKRKVGGAE